MKYFLHDNDLPIEIDVGNSIAIDTETTGLNLTRDRLCLIQICTENKEIRGDGMFRKHFTSKILIDIVLCFLPM